MFATITWIAGGLMMVAGVALALRERHRRVTGLALGVFDFCHEGHANLLRRAAERCDRLVVGVHTDAAVRDYKGVQPANSELERAAAIRELGLAAEVVVGSDRTALCRRYRISCVFHGDDWDPATYRRHWGEDLLGELGVELVMLPHTAGIDSTRLRAQVPRIGWWLYSSVPDWSRAHIFSHLRALYAELGGIWFVAGSGRELVRSEFPGAPCVLLESGQEAAAAARAITHYDLDVIVTAHFNYEAMTDVLGDLGRRIDLAVLSHGRSGKPGTSADAARRHQGMSVVDASGASSGARLYRCGDVTVHDWSFAPDGYLHLDRFLAGGGRFENPAPAGRPRILVLPTWGPDRERRGLLLSRRWYEPFAELARDCDVLLSPHPLCKVSDVGRFALAVGAEVLPSSGGSHVHVPGVHCTVSDLSGVFWEALLFDTPAVLARCLEPAAWPCDMPPSREKTLAVAGCCSPADLAATVRSRLGARAPGQHSLAEERLGMIDGAATRRLAQRIRAMLKEPARRGSIVVSHDARTL